MSNGGNGSHWEGCWKAHHDCAVAEVERLRTVLSRQFVRLDNSQEVRTVFQESPDQKLVPLYTHDWSTLLRARELIWKFIAVWEAMLDPDECRLDHHGYCQSHNLGRPCEQVLLREAISQAKAFLEGKAT